MKITFVSPFYENVWEALGVGYIASYVKDKNPYIELQFLHGNFDNDIAKKCVDSDIVAFSCTTPTFDNGLKLATEIKELNSNIHIVFGGWHVTALKKNIWDVIDTIVIGEGEWAFNEIVNGNRNKEVFGKMLPFNELNWPDRKLIKQDKTLDLCDSICGERIASFQSRRGCPMNCKMCAESCMTKNTKVRVRHPKDLLSEIQYVNNVYNITKFKFLDPTWCYPKSAVFDFCEEKIKSGIDIKWEGMAHAGFITKNMLKIMKASGCDQINIGVESGSQKILNDINKGVTVNKIKKVFKWGHELDLSMRAFFILGTSEESNDSIRKTEQLVEEINPDYVGFSILCPYPGSDYYNLIKDKDIDWSRADEYTNDFWETKNFTNIELKTIQKKLYNKFKKTSVYRMHELINNG